MKTSKALIFFVFLICIVLNLKSLSAQTFTETSIGALGGVYEGKIICLDIDGDNDNDLIICGGLSLRVYKNNSGQFTEFYSHNLPHILHPAIGTADFNKDGYIDIVLSGVFNGGDDSSIPQSNVFINDGSGSFTKSVTAQLLPLFRGSIDCADFDNDGDFDILMTGYDKHVVAQSVIFSNNNDGSFSQVTTAILPGVVNGSYGVAGTWGDFDSDGDMDILISGDNFIDNKPNRPVTKVFKNNGDRTFSEQFLELPQLNGKSTWVDVNNDGLLDIFVTGIAADYSPGKSAILINLNNSFSNSSNIVFKEDRFTDFTFADLDNDGDKDLIALNSIDNKTSIYINQEGSFTVLANVNFPTLSVISAGNFDQDGDIDILMSGFDESYHIVTKAFRNNINISNSKPSSPGDLSYQYITSLESNFSWSESVDSETSASAIEYALSIGTAPGKSDIIRPSFNGSGFILSETCGLPSHKKDITINNLLNGVYYARVQAVDQSFNASPSSNEVKFTISGVSDVPLKPLKLSLTNLNTNFVNISWIDQSFNEDKFIIERSTDNITYTVLQTLDKNQTGYVDKSVKFGQLYYYRIKATNMFGDSDFSQEEFITSLPKGLFQKLEGFEVADDEYNSSSGANWVDFNNDDTEDIFFANSPNLLYKNQVGNTFTRITTGNLISFEIQIRNACWADYDNDGDEDVFIATSSLNHLFKNNGDETFTDVIASPFTEDLGDTNSAAWIDYDNDGYLDLSFVNYQLNNCLYHNNQNGTFTKINHSPFTSDAGDYASISWCDYNNDGWQDAFVVNYSGNSILYKNKGAGVFERVIDPVTFSGSGAITSSWADYDNDGDFDVYVGHNVNQSDAFFENNGNGSFQSINNTITQVNAQATSSAWGDFDNNGNIDLLVVTDKEKVLFKNNGDKSFSALTNEPSLSNRAYGKGVAFGDYNKDGFQDVIIANGYDENIVLKNNGNNNHWISIKLMGSITNRDAIGAKVKIKSNGIWRMNYITSQSGYHGQNSFDVKFGLGVSASIDSIVVEWPQNGFQVLTNVSTDQFIIITEPTTFEIYPALISAVYNETTNKVDLVWKDNSSHEAGFMVEKSVRNQYNFKESKVVDANSTAYSETPTIVGDSLFYRISATNEIGISWYSNVKSVYIPENKTIVTSTEEGALKQFEFYPNPANEFVIAKNLGGSPNVKIVTLMGVELISQEVENNGYVKIGVQDLSAGVYILKHSDVNGVHSSRLIITR